MDPKVIFAFNKHVNGPETETSSWESNWLISLKQEPGLQLFPFNPDDDPTQDLASCDSKLLELAWEVKPNYLVMIHLGRVNEDFISTDALEELQRQGVRIVAIWGDIQSPRQRRKIKMLSHVVDVHLVTASSFAASRLGRRRKVVYSFVPLSDPQVSEYCSCGAQVSFAGTPKPDREKVIKTLESAGILVHAFGGEKFDALSRLDYLRVLAHPMSLSFQNSGCESIEPVMNARPYEIVRQGSLLLEQVGPETPRVFAVGEEYVQWRTTKDLIEKIRFYLIHEEERKKIADSGQESYRAFSSTKIWNHVFERCSSSALGLSTTMVLHSQSTLGSQRLIRRLVQLLLQRPSLETVISFLGESQFLICKLWALVRLLMTSPGEFIAKLRQST